MEIKLVNAAHFIGLGLIAGIALGWWLSREKKEKHICSKCRKVPDIYYDDVRCVWCMKCGCGEAISLYEDKLIRSWESMPKLFNLSTRF